MLLGFIGIYLLITISIGAWAARKVKSTTDFVVAGRNLEHVWISVFWLVLRHFGHRQGGKTGV